MDRRHRGLWYDAYLVGLDCGYLFIGRNGLADLLLPRLERAFRNGLGHLWHFDGLICPKASTQNTVSVHDEAPTHNVKRDKEVGPNSARTP